MTEPTPELTMLTESAPVTNAKKTISPPHLNIPKQWLPLVSYEFEMTNRNRTPKHVSRTGAIATRKLDIYDLAILDEVRSFQRGNIKRRCYIDTPALADAIFLPGRIDEVNNRVLQLIHIGLLNAHMDIVAIKGNPSTHLILEFNEEAANGLIEAIETQRFIEEQEKLIRLKNGEKYRRSKPKEGLLEYIQEYIQEEKQEHNTRTVPEYPIEQVTEQPIENDKSLSEVNGCSLPVSDCMGNDISISSFVYEEDITEATGHSASMGNNEYICEDYKAAVRERYPETTVNHFPKIPYTAIVNDYADTSGVDVSADDFDDEGTLTTAEHKQPTPRFTGQDSGTVADCTSQPEVAETDRPNTEPMINGRTVRDVHRELQAFLHDLDPVAKFECFMPCVKENGRLLEAYKTAEQGNTVPLENWYRCAEEYIHTH